MRNLKKLCSLVLTVAILATTLTGCSTATTGPAFKAGTYSSEAMGMHKLTVNVTFDETSIVEITVDHNETPGVGEPAVERMVEKIVSNQALGIDTFAGATLTCQGILDGVQSAMVLAGASDAVIEQYLNATETAKEKAEDINLTTDVIIVGAGGAGMTAAITANQNGSNVIILEKNGVMGGNTILSGGALNAVDEGSEIAASTKDSVELHYTHTFDGGDQQAKPELVRTLVTNAWSGVEWLKDLGMEFNETPVTVAGALWQRGQQPVEPEGIGFFKAYEEYLNNNSDTMEILYYTTATDLIVEDGVVTGVVATGETGNTVTVTANNGVVIATGGFAANPEMLADALENSDVWPELGDDIKSTNTSTITGDGIRMAEAVGANLIQMNNIQLLPLGDPSTGSLSGNIGHGPVSFIFVNKEGERFTDEGGRRDDMTLDLFEQTDKTLYMIMDSDTYEKGTELNNFGEHINDLVDSGRAYKADTLEELAELIGVPADVLVATIEEYNKYCVGGELFGEADEFGRTLFTDAAQVNNGINTAPYYAAARVPTVHHTMGGIEINENTEVLDTNGNVIPGLFAAGEATGGIHGTNRLGGNALTDMLVFGRIAGSSASTFTK